MNCPACDSPVSPKARFCGNCQANLTKVSAPLPEADTNAPQPQPANEIEPRLRESVSPAAIKTEAAPAENSNVHEVPPSPAIVQPNTPENAPAVPVATSPQPAPAVPTIDGSPPSPVLPPSTATGNRPLLYLTFHRMFVQRCGTEIRVDVVNHTKQAWTDVVLTLSCTGFTAKARERAGKLAADERRTISMHVDNGESIGDKRLEISIAYVAAGHRKKWVGKAGLKIHAFPDTTNINQVVDVQRTYALENYHQEIHFPKIDTVNDLLNVTLPATPLPVELHAPSGWLEIPDKYLDSVELTNRLRLVPQSGDGLELYFTATATIQIGRESAGTDVITKFWPENEDNRLNSARLSRQHLKGCVRDGLPQFIDEKSPGGTYWQDRRLANDEWVPIRDSESLQLNGRNGRYHLNIRNHPSQSQAGLNVANMDDWRGNDEAPNSAPDATGAITFTPENSQPYRQRIIWTLTDATIGRDPHCAVHLTPPQLAPLQCRVHYFRGMFWLQNLADNESVELDDELIEESTLAPLCVGQHLRIGEANYLIQAGG